ncbi:amino acid permease [Prauserella sp. PE36]|uniref:Amino acid permease n=1 Tax=Prauserella endophytica TaxID=1592324 RepID=A0ABY2S2Y8_9PSEU|nr:MULTISPECIES: APC family permease [Prauserella]PXY37044.1 amino acid permease [Prauserella coralliicola]RBM10290.1 amino acid permease [Prauserella sp. PE36]TKG68398.1 amino acid permease [Prauserella endophytica]
MADATTTTPDTSGSGQPALRRVMGSKLLLFFVVGDIIGTGVYALTGQVAGRVGGALWLPFLLAFIVAFMTAFSYLELVGKYPKAAGAALYANRAFRIRILTFLVAFAVMCSGITSASSAAVAFGETYLAEFITSPMPLVAILFILMLAAINFRGVKESVTTNVVLTCIELAGLLIIIGVGVWAVLNGDGEPSRLVEFNTQDQTWLVAITSATSLAFFAMVGFEDSVNMAEECKDPVRIFPKAMLWGMVIAATIYILVSVTSSLLVPANELEAAESSALLKVIDIGAPGMPREIFSAIGLFAVINSALINMLMASRLIYGMANERIIPKQLGTVHPFRRSPWVAILFTSAIAIVLVSTVDISVLGGTTALLLLAVFAVVNIAVLVLRKEKVEHKHFRAPTVIPVLAAIFCIYLASPLSGRPARDYVVALILLAVGLVLWVVNWFFMRGAEQKELDEKALAE